MSKKAVGLRKSCENTCSELPAGVSPPSTDRKTTARRVARCAAVVLAGGLLIAGAILVFGPSNRQTALAEGPPMAPPLPEPGSARPWEAQIQVSTYSSVHTRTGNLLTTIPIIGWSGKGPAMSMALYHNSANVDSTLPLTAGQGFDMGPGWTVSYSSQIIRAYPQGGPWEAMVVADDGTQTVFTSGQGGWHAPAGVHSRLYVDDDTWKLRHKDGSYEEYEEYDEGGTIRLTKVVDAVGNELTIDYVGSGSRIDIIDASGRVLLLHRGAGERLVAISDPDASHEGEPVGDEDDDSTLPAYREWELIYDAGRLTRIRDAMGYDNVVEYDADGRIAVLSDRGYQDAVIEDLDAYQYDYDTEGHLTLVTDPEPDDPAVTALVQEFRMTTSSPGSIKNYYTDRRGNEWMHQYNNGEEPTIFPDGNLAGITNPLAGYKSFFYDSNRNLIKSYDETGRRRDYTYDFYNRLVTATVDINGLNLTQTWTYDNHHNVSSYTDAAENTVTFDYWAEYTSEGTTTNYPTLLTAIHEPATATLPDCTTTITYHLDGSSGHGQVLQVTDPNGVVTEFGYDQWGQATLYEEGKKSDGTSAFRRISTPDSAGRVITSLLSGDGGLWGGTVAAVAAAGGGITSYSNNNQITRTTCAEDGGGIAAVTTPPDGFPLLPTAVGLPRHYGEIWNTSYSPKGELETMKTGEGLSDPNDPDFGTETYSSETYIEYDELGRVISNLKKRTREMWARWVDRPFSYTYDIPAGETTRIGPDEVETLMRLDVLGRVQYVRRGPEEAALMWAMYTYYDNGLLKSTTYGNNAQVFYAYDAANRLTQIEHRDGSNDTILQLDYVYTDNDLVASITETDAGGNVFETTFDYDSRGRLIYEQRALVSGMKVYDLAYEYDQGGNRTKMTDSTTDADNPIEVFYHYDIDSETLYDTKANRLMYYEVHDPGTFQQAMGPMGMGVGGMGMPGGSVPPSVVKTWYYYNELGNVTRVVTNKEGTSAYSATRFGYPRNKQVATFALGESWTWNGDPASNPDGYTVDYAREFRYDGTRQRYLSRELDTGQLRLHGELESVSETWSDFDGNSAYGDYTVIRDDPPPGWPYPTVYTVEQRSYSPGIGKFDWTDGDPDTSTLKHYHTDMIGTARMMTDNGGAGTAAGTFTAFGVQVGGTAQRYGYAGAHGYQTATSDTQGDSYGTDFKFMHVGARYYDPATGRFLQRDPIGIRGGLNVYAYVGNAPTNAVDPSGHGWWSDVVNAVLPVVGIPVGVALIIIGVAITSPIWGPVAIGTGVVVLITTAVTISNSINVHRLAKQVVSPIVPGVRRRNRAVDQAMDCGG